MNTLCPHCHQPFPTHHPAPLDPKSRKAALLSYLRTAPGASLQELADAVGYASRSTPLAVLRVLQHEGRVQQVRGRWRVAE